MILKRLPLRKTVDHLLTFNALFTLSPLKRCECTPIVFPFRSYTDHSGQLSLSSRHGQPPSPKEEKRLAAYRQKNLLKALCKGNGTDAVGSGIPLSTSTTIVQFRHRVAGLSCVVSLLKTQQISSSLPNGSAKAEPINTISDRWWLDDISSELRALISPKDNETCLEDNGAIFPSITTNGVMGVVLHTCVELLNDLNDLWRSSLRTAEVISLRNRTVTLSEDLVQWLSASIQAVHVINNDQKSDNHPVIKWDENTLSTAIRIQCILIEFELDSTNNNTGHSMDQLSLAMKQSYPFLRHKGWVRHRSMGPLIAACYKVLRFCVEQQNQVYMASILPYVSTLCADSRTHSVHLDALDYQHILQCYSSASCFAVTIGSKCSTIAFPLGTLHHILSQMAIEAPLLTHDAAEAVELWINCLKDMNNPLVLDGHLPINRVHTVGCKLEDHKEEDAIMVREDCCVKCGTRLVGQPFTSTRKQFLLKEIRNIAQQRPLKKNNTIKNVDNRFDAFVRSLSTSPPFSSIIDGANVGYYGLSSWYPHRKAALLIERGELSQEKAKMYLDEIYQQKDETEGFTITRRMLSNNNPLRFNRDRPYVDVPPSFTLIDAAATMMEREHGLQSLIFLHSRHVDAVMNVTDSHQCGKRHHVHCSERISTDAELVKKWREQGRLFGTPNGVDDDLCWLYASIHGTVPTDDKSTGKEKVVYVLTNDKMRDHSFAMLSQDVISRWRHRHQVHFDCNFDKESGTSQLRLKFPPIYENVVQFDAKREIWHIPYNGFKTHPKSAGGTDIDALDSSNEGAPRWMCLRADTIRL